MSKPVGGRTDREKGTGNKNRVSNKIDQKYRIICQRADAFEQIAIPSHPCRRGAVTQPTSVSLLEQQIHENRRAESAFSVLRISQITSVDPSFSLGLSNILQFFQEARQ